MHQHVHAVLEVGHPHVPHVLNRQQIAFESACRIIPWGAALAALKLEEEHDDAVYVLVGSTKQTGPVLARWVLQLERAVIVEDEARLPREVSDRIRQFSIEDERARWPRQRREIYLRRRRSRRWQFRRRTCSSWRGRS